VAKAVAAANGEYDLGITFDGDADRAMFSDASGRVVNGDGVLLLTARDMKTHVRLHADTVVATTMSNMGLEAALQRGGIRMLRAPVGDKYVLEEMLKTGATLGGEQSGHILFRDMDTTTGDGILTALRVLEVMARTGQRDLDGNGRVVVRYSGTEKLARVMIEAETEELMRRHTDAIANAIQRAIGV
jgi:phosphoglucosamine mutase